MNGRTLLIILGVTALLVWLAPLSLFAVTGAAFVPWAFLQFNPGPFLLMALAIPLVAIIGTLFVVALKGAKGDGGNRSRVSDDLPMDEGEMIQEIYNGLNRMERRIEALETILFDRASQHPPAKPFTSEEKNAESD